MTIIGITGLIGAGKSTVSLVLEKQTAATISNADKVAKDLIKEHGIDNTNVIGNNAKLDEVERKLKPYFLKYYENLKKKNTGKKFIIMDAPVLYEYGLEAYCDYVINVYCDEKTRTERVKARNHPSMEAFKFLNDRQKKTDVRMQRADFTIDTGKSPRDVEMQVMEIIGKIIEKERAKAQPTRPKKNNTRQGKTSKDRG